jgi:hypothetical protein
MLKPPDPEWSPDRRTLHQQAERFSSMMVASSILPIGDAHPMC